MLTKLRPVFRKGSYPDKFFTLRSTYLQGRQPRCVNMYWRRFAISDIPLDDPKEFDAWIRARWTEKDQLLDECFETGLFPTDLAGTVDFRGINDVQKAVAASEGYVETSVRLRRWYEAGQIFAVLAGAACLCKLSADLCS